MKIKFLALFILLLASADIFAFEMGPQFENVQEPKREKLFEKQEKKMLKAQKKADRKSEKQQKALLKAQNKQEKKQKKELDRELKKQFGEQKKQEKQIEKENKRLQKKLDKEHRKLIAEQAKDKKAEDGEQRKREKLHAKEAKAREKAERKKSELQKIQQAQEREPDLTYSSLVLDYDLKFAACSYSNLDYTLPQAEGAAVYRQYLGVNIIGKFDDRIEMSAKIVSRGNAGKHAGGIFAMPYSGDDFSFFLESAYLNFTSAVSAARPYVFTVGKQYFTAGDGLIIDSNGNGFLGARIRADISRMISADAFAAKADDKDFNIYGGNIKIKSSPALEAGIYQERNDTGFAYRKGIFTGLPAYAIKSDIKTFYDIRLTGGEKYKYRLEAARQTGELVKSSSTAVEYDAFAFVAEGGWKGMFLKRKSSAKILFSYAQAKGDNVFNPTFSRRYDGLRRIGYGALFAAGTGDSFLNLAQGYKGINTAGLNFDIFPWSFLQTGAAFYLYSASEAPPDSGDAGFAKLYGAKADLGNETDFFVKYKYLDYFDAGFAIAVYTPPTGADKVFANTERSYLYQIEVNAKF